VTICRIVVVTSLDSLNQQWANVLACRPHRIVKFDRGVGREHDGLFAQTNVKELLTP